jgi:1-deoxy-D-xylulose-5-phosphate reductoisomerase
VLARRALAAGGSSPAVLNAADEEAVQLFLGRKIRFGDLMPLVEEVLNAYRPGTGAPTLESILEADRWARARLHEAARPMTRG